ncbi:MAG: DUF2157 domain-containing protein [Chitinophagaceae bacterium]|nr:MAG: DUF2157 domain-containing protein [Chitinophagaceae bacterium]
MHVISRHSDLNKSSAGQLLVQHVHNNKNDWSKFLRLLFVGLGIGFLCAGIVMFFAYNWNYLHRFAKLAILESLLATTAMLAVINRFKLLVRNALLAGSTILVGALFAVYGQIYQTGADAYDFFFGWTIAVTIWAVISGFPVLWLIYLGLINVTLGLYVDQANLPWEQATYYTLFLTLNLLVVFILVLLSWKKKMPSAPQWFINAISLFCIFLATAGTINSLFTYQSIWLGVLLLVVAGAYAGGLFYGFKTRQMFYLALIPLSAIIILTALLMRISDEIGMMMIVVLTAAGGVAAVIKALVDLQKKWRIEKQS